MPAPFKPQVSIRAIVKNDAQAAFDLQKDLFPGDINSLTLDEFAAPLANGPVKVLVAETDSGVVGFIVLRTRGLRPWTGIDFVGVASQASGKGMGRRLLEEAAFCSARPWLRLFVRPSNAPARALYARLGFRHTSTRTASYADGEDALVLMKWVGFTPFRSKPKNL